MRIKNLKKNELFLFILFLAINAYLFSLLVFVTCKEIFNLDSNFISALGSIISAFATFFAALVAVVLFKEWKKQARYLESVKLINKIKLQIKYLFNEVENKRNLHEYQSYIMGLIGESLQKKDAFGEVNKRILTGQQRFEEFNRFRETLKPIFNNINELNILIEELATYLDKDLSNLLEINNLEFKGIIKELEFAYIDLFLFLVESHPGYPSQKTIDNLDIRLANTILSPHSNLSIEFLKSDKYIKYEKHFLIINNGSFFSYDEVLKDREEKFLITLSQVRKDHIE
ncbi:hypothetical protein [Acinetobacter baumannii]|uniref:hypothetical protein n=1 Tax=Acinetobacter baumannii TaxID=470 RepID=UPI00374A7E7E